jgi:hypothetical protein
VIFEGKHHLRKYACNAWALSSTRNLKGKDKKYLIIQQAQMHIHA